MKKISSSNSKAAGGKAFYLALILSVAAVGSVAYFTIGRLSESLDTTSDAGSQQSIEWSVPEGFDEVNKPKTDVPKELDPLPESSKVTESVSTAETSETPSEETFFFSSGKEESEAPQSGYILPIDGEVGNPYSAGELVKSKTLGEWRTHDGIDVFAAEGTPVKAVGNGIVLDVREDRQWGVIVEVEHKDFTAIYAGISPEVQVNKGEEVVLGDVLGYVGNSSVIESAEEPHLHFAVKVNGQWADPLSALGK